MQNKLFLKASDICELLEVKQTSAYEIIGNLNDYSGAHCTFYAIYLQRHYSVVLQLFPQTGRL